MTVEPNKQTQHIYTIDNYYTGRRKTIHSNMTDNKLSIHHKHPHSQYILCLVIHASTSTKSDLLFKLRTGETDQEGISGRSGEEEKRRVILHN